MRATDRRIARMRLAAQRISSSDLESPVAVVRWMTALQAQDFYAAKWAIGLRSPGLNAQSVDDAFARGEIVRSWPMRGTLHIVAAEDLGWMLELTSARQVRGSETRRKGLGLSDRDLELARATAINGLTGGLSMTRDQLYELFEREGIATTGQRGYHLLWFLALTGTLCGGPTQDARPAFVLQDEWIRSPRALGHDEALGEWVYRYFRSHGPASVRDFAWWSSTTLGEARIGLAIAGGRLSQMEWEGETLYFAPETGSGTDGVRMLPGFDEYLLGYRDRRPQLAAHDSQAVTPGNNGVFFPTMVSDGEVVGTWKRSTSLGGEHNMAPFRDLSARAARGFARVGNGYSRFVATP